MLLGQVRDADRVILTKRRKRGNPVTEIMTGPDAAAFLAKHADVECESRPELGGFAASLHNHTQSVAVRTAAR